MTVGSIEIESASDGGEAGEAELDDPDRVDEQAGDDGRDAAHRVDEDPHRPPQRAADLVQEDRAEEAERHRDEASPGRPARACRRSRAQRRRGVAGDSGPTNCCVCVKKCHVSAWQALHERRSPGSAPAARPSPGRPSATTTAIRRSPASTGPSSSRDDQPVDREERSVGRDRKPTRPASCRARRLKASQTSAEGRAGAAGQHAGIRRAEPTPGRRGRSASAATAAMRARRDRVLDGGWPSDLDSLRRSATGGRSATRRC